MRLREFKLAVRYKKGLLNTPADALFYLRLLGKTIVQIYADISTYPLYSIGCSSQNRGGKNNISAEVVLTTDTSLSFVPITLKEVRLSQVDDEFSHTMRACLGKRQRTSFALVDDNFLFRSVDGFEEVEIPQSFVPRVRHLSCYSKKAGR